MLAADQSLASYGIGAEHGSAMLELIPAPFGSSGSGSGIQRAAAGGKPNSPPLSSPEHGLFANWQAAREGLASGQLPQLAPSGSGGSYFLRSAAGDKVLLCLFVHSRCICTLVVALHNSGLVQDAIGVSQGC